MQTNIYAKCRMPEEPHRGQAEAGGTLLCSSPNAEEVEEEDIRHIDNNRDRKQRHSVGQ